MHRSFVIAIIIVVARCDTQVTNNRENLNISVTTWIPSGTVEHSVAPNICDTCECTIGIINCTGRQLIHHFENGLWPVTTTASSNLVTFEENAIVHLKPFPNITINKLILRFNRIARIDDKVFEQIRNLTELDLSHNHLTSAMLRPSVFEGRFNPNQWEPLPKLRVLNLGHNNLHTLNADIFAHVPDVEVLILSGNPLDIIDHSTIIALSNLYYLEELGLEYCNLQTLPDHLFHVHKLNLKKLYLNGNGLTIIPSALTEATALEYLNLDENTFESFNYVNAFPKLPMLKELSVSSLPYLTRIGAGTFSHLTSLEILTLCDCPRLQDIDEDAIILHDIHGSTWPPLKTLDISNNGLKYLPQSLIQHWNKLVKLDLSGNEWSCDCENEYLVGTLLPTYGKILMGDDVNKMFCSGPPEHAGRNMSALEHRKLRCLDRYGARPERDAAILVGLLIGILLVIPIVLALFFLWRRGFFFCSDQNPATFSRAFYQRASNDDYI